jgi:hypothetical protein
MMTFSPNTGAKKLMENARQPKLPRTECGQKQDGC